MRRILHSRGVLCKKGKYQAAARAGRVLIRAAPAVSTIERQRRELVVSCSLSPRGKQPLRRCADDPRRRLGVCRAPVIRLFIIGGLPIAVRVLSPTPLGTAAGPFYSLSPITRLLGRGDTTRSRRRLFQFGAGQRCRSKADCEDATASVRALRSARRLRRDPCGCRG